MTEFVTKEIAERCARRFFGKKVFDFIYDQDRKEYNCFNYNNNQKYSNLQGTKFPNLPDFVIKRVQRYANVGMQNLQQYIKQKYNDGKGK